MQRPNEDSRSAPIIDISDNVPSAVVPSSTSPAPPQAATRPVSRTDSYHIADAAFHEVFHVRNIHELLNYPLPGEASADLSGDAAHRHTATFTTVTRSGTSTASIAGPDTLSEHLEARNPAGNLSQAATPARPPSSNVITNRNGGHFDGPVLVERPGHGNLRQVCGGKEGLAEEQGQGR